MANQTVVIVGASGTVGLELRARLAQLEGITVVEVGSMDSAEYRAEVLEAADLGVLCLPEFASQEFMRTAPETWRILDASPAHRTAPDWQYGLAELGVAHLIRDSPRVTNPGCYATGAILLLMPLIAALPSDKDLQVTIAGIGGVSSGGRNMIAAASADPFGYRLYGLDQGHRHIPEIQRYAGLSSEPIFMPAVAGHARGTIVQIPFTKAHLGLEYEEVVQLLQSAYAGSSRVKVLHAESTQRYLAPELMAGSDELHIRVLTDATRSRFVLTAQFDNLGIGAAGAAAYNVQLMLGRA